MSLLPGSCMNCSYLGPSELFLSSLCAPRADRRMLMRIVKHMDTACVHASLEKRRSDEGILEQRLA